MLEAAVYGRLGRDPETRIKYDGTERNRVMAIDSALQGKRSGISSWELRLDSERIAPPGQVDGGRIVAWHPATSASSTEPTAAICRRPCIAVRSPMAKCPRVRPARASTGSRPARRARQFQWLAG